MPEREMSSNWGEMSAPERIPATRLASKARGQGARNATRLKDRQYCQPAGGGTTSHGYALMQNGFSGILWCEM